MGWLAVEGTLLNRGGGDKREPGEPVQSAKCGEKEKVSQECSRMENRLILKRAGVSVIRGNVSHCHGCSS